jgi:ribosome assembly protein YihI (activator of Der GTPase)
MAAAAHDPKFARKMGIPVGVAREFNQADQQKAHASKLAAALARR